MRPSIGSGDYVDSSTSKPSHDTGVYALVRVQKECQFQPLPQLSLSSASPTRIPVTQGCYQCLTIFPVTLDPLAMVVVIGEGGVNFGQAKVRVRFGDLVRSHTQVFILRRNLADLDVSSSDHRARPRVIDVGRHLFRNNGHDPRLARPLQSHKPATVPDAL